MRISDWSSDVCSSDLFSPGCRIARSMTADRPIEDLSFEEALHELEAIVSRLESGETPLQDAIDLYERGNKLRRRRADRLAAAQARIDALRLDAEGRPVGRSEARGVGAEGVRTCR